MAGFDAVFKFKEHDRPIVEACIAAMRRRARRFSIRFRAVLGVDSAYVEMNGNTYQLDIFLERLRRDLPTIAEPVASRRAPDSRRKAAAGLVEIIVRYRLGLYDNTDGKWVPTLRARSKPIQAFIHEIYPHDTSGLQERMFVTMDLLASWHFGEVPAPILIEEVHTASELLMKSAIVGSTSRLTYAQLVERALAQGAFDYHTQEERERRPLSVTERDRSRQRARADLLFSLKNVRRGVKHDGSSGAEEWLAKHYWDTAQVLELLSLNAKRALIT